MRARNRFEKCRYDIVSAQNQFRSAINACPYPQRLLGCPRKVAISQDDLSDLSIGSQFNAWSDLEMFHTVYQCFLTERWKTKRNETKWNERSNEMGSRAGERKEWERNEWEGRGRTNPFRGRFVWLHSLNVRPVRSFYPRYQFLLCRARSRLLPISSCCDLERVVGCAAERIEIERPRREI